MHRTVCDGAFGLVASALPMAECAARASCFFWYPLNSAICNHAASESISPAHVWHHGRALLSAHVMMPARYAGYARDGDRRGGGGLDFRFHSWSKALGWG